MPCGRCQQRAELRRQRMEAAREARVERRAQEQAVREQQRAVPPPAPADRKTT